MLWYYAPALLMLLHTTICFPSGKTTEKPEMPVMFNPKHRRPSHISEFTDPDTGLNPFLDLEEGLASMGRNVMEDERPDDQPYFGIDLVEGDAPDRKWDLNEPIEHFSIMPSWRPEPEKDEFDLPVATTPIILPNPPTTAELFITRDMDSDNTDAVGENTSIQDKVKKEEKETSVVAQSTVIYATAAIAVLSVVILLIGACWWRRKLKVSHSSTAAENGEAKS